MVVDAGKTASLSGKRAAGRVNLPAAFAYRNDIRFSSPSQPQMPKQLQYEVRFMSDSV
jgi:hypothetical protein